MRGGPVAMATGRTLRSEHPHSGLWPIVLGDVSEQVVDQLTWRVEFLAGDRPGIPDLDDIPLAPELFVLDTMEFIGERPPEDARGAFDLAVQHYAYCPELMDNLAPAIGALAATDFGRHWWLKW